MAIASLKMHIIIPFRLWLCKTDGGSANAGSLKDFKSFLVPPWQSVEHSQNIKSDEEICHDYQAYNYFHPFVRRFWYDPEKVARFRRTDIAELHVRPSGWGMPDLVKFKVMQCELIRFDPDVCLLHIALDAIGTLPLNVVQACLDQVRRIYPPYFDSYQNGQKENIWKAGHYPQEVLLIDSNGKELIDNSTSFPEDMNGSVAERDDLLKAAHAFRAKSDDSKNNVPKSYLWAKHWRYLLQPLITESPKQAGLHAIQLGDDRAGIASYIAFENIAQLKALDRGNWVRLCFADAPGTDPLPYSRSQLNDFEERFCYDRFWYVDGESTDAPSRIMNCGYAFTWAGSKNDKAYFTNTLNGAPAIFEDIYVPMAIIAHFLRAALLIASARLSELSGQRDVDEMLLDLDRKEFDDFYRHFIAFTQTYWFDEISPQEQAIEMFAMWRKHFRIQELYDEVRQELKDSMELINTKIAAKLASNSHDLTKIATAFAIPALVATLVSMFTSLFALSSLSGPAALKPLWPLIMPWLMVLLSNVLITVSVVTLLGVTWFFIRNLKWMRQLFQSGEDEPKC